MVVAVSSVLSCEGLLQFVGALRNEDCLAVMLVGGRRTACGCQLCWGSTMVPFGGMEFLEIESGMLEL